MLYFSGDSLKVFLSYLIIILFLCVSASFISHAGLEETPKYLCCVKPNTSEWSFLCIFLHAHFPLPQRLKLHYVHFNIRFARIFLCSAFLRSFCEDLNFNTIPTLYCFCGTRLSFLFILTFLPRCRLAFSSLPPLRPSSVPTCGMEVNRKTWNDVDQTSCLQSLALADDAGYILGS